MSVKPFPVRRCGHYLEMARCHIEAQPPAKRNAYLRQIIQQHRDFLTNAGIEPGLIEREIRDLKLALSPSPTPTGGMRLVA